MNNNTQRKVEAWAFLAWCNGMRALYAAEELRGVAPRWRRWLWLIRGHILARAFSWWRVAERMR